MIKALLFTGFTLFSAVGGLHPFHISVTEIVHKPKEKVIQVSIRLFVDDFEETLQTFTGNESMDILKADNTYLNTEIEKYLGEAFRITGKKPVELQYLGFEFDRDVVWCYLEGTKVKPFDELTVNSTIMTEIFADQENLVHARRDGKVKSLRLSKARPEDAVSWAD